MTAGFIRRFGGIIAGAGEVFCLHPGQLDGLAALERRVKGKQVIVGNRDGHPADQLIKLVDAGDIHADVIVNLRAVIRLLDAQQLFHCPDGVLIVLLARPAVGVRQAQLQAARPRVLAVGRNKFDGGHRVAVKLQLMNLLILMVNHQQQKKVRLPAEVILARLFLNLTICVVVIADEQNRRQFRRRVRKVLLAVLRPRRKETEIVRHCRTAEHQQCQRHCQQTNHLFPQRHCPFHSFPDRTAGAADVSPSPVCELLLLLVTVRMTHNIVYDKCDDLSNAKYHKMTFSRRNSPSKGLS